MKRLFWFLRRHYLFGGALLAALIGLALALTKHHAAAHWLLGVVSIGETLPAAWQMWQNVRSGRYGINLLAVAAIVTAVILGQYWTAILLVLMLTGIERLEKIAERRVRRELGELLRHAPQEAHVMRKGKQVDVRIAELRAGDKIVIKADELVPVEAVVLDGSANFDESALTGESLPAAKQAGDQLLSGSNNLDGLVTAKATTAAHDSQFQRTIRLLRGAAAAQAPFVRLTERYSLPFTFLAFGIAAGMWVLSSHAIRFLEVIVVATPGPLLLAAPLAIGGGLARASRYGIFIKTGSAFEKLATAHTMAFSKAGTLTHDQLILDEVQAFGSYDKSDVLRLAASLEQSSAHPVARATVEAAKAQQLKLAKVKHVQATPGRGLKAMLQGREIAVGRLSYLQELSVQIPPKFQADKFKHTAAFVSLNGELAGVLAFKDEQRAEAKTAIGRLKQLGVKQLAIITGDSQAAAQSLAGQLAIKMVQADMLPADKIHAIERFKQRPLVFVGGSMDDTPALMAADVGIALGARNSEAAGESADVIIMQPDLSRIATATAIAKHTFRLAKQTILAGLGLSLALMAVFATGKLSPLTGAILQTVVDVFVVFNALRAHLSN